MSVQEVIPIQLQTLFKMMDFIALAKTGNKPCFNGFYYVSANSWIGGIQRILYGESQSSYGNDKIQKCCEEAVQSYGKYGDVFDKIIMDKMIAMREGIAAIRDTYATNPAEVETIIRLNQAILILNMKIPETEPPV